VYHDASVFVAMLVLTGVGGIESVKLLCSDCILICGEYLLSCISLILMLLFNHSAERS